MGLKPTILDEAARITSEDRQSAYGHPRDHFAATAAAITGYLRQRKLLGPGQSIEARDWPMFLILDKAMRYGNMPKWDSLVDIAGYARTAEMLDEAPGALDICE